MYEYKEGDVIYLKYMKFADSNKIDYRVNGRPYLVFRRVGEKLLLLKIGSRKFGPDYLFSKVNVVNKNDKRECYVDMRYYFLVDEKQVIRNFDSVFNDSNQYIKKSLHGSKISKGEFKEVQNQVKILEQIKEIKLANMNKDTQKKNKKNNNKKTSKEV